MTNKTKRPRGANPRAKTGKTGDLLFTPILPHDGEKDNTQNSFYNDLLARLAELERRGAIIDARLAELDVFYTGDLDGETEQVR